MSRMFFVEYSIIIKMKTKMPTTVKASNNIRVRKTMLHSNKICIIYF